jgi:ankyrin repeat protein
MPAESLCGIPWLRFIWSKWKLLFRLGASINYQNPNNKYTALHYAISGNNTEAICVLLDSGAKTNIRNADVSFYSNPFVLYNSKSFDYFLGGRYIWICS